MKIPPIDISIIVNLEELKNTVDLYDIKLNSFSFEVGTISDSSNGFRYRCYKNSGILTSVSRIYFPVQNMYKKTIIIDAKILEINKFQNEVLDILTKKPCVHRFDGEYIFHELKMKLSDTSRNMVIEVQDVLEPIQVEELNNYLESYFMGLEEN